MYNIPLDSRYWDPTYLTQSTLNNFASYDVYGSATYNIHAVINKTPPESDAILIGYAMDKSLTEWDHYSNNYIPVAKRVGEPTEDGKIKVTNSMWGAMEIIEARANNFQYSPTESFMELASRCEKQVVLQDDERRMKGKPDFIDRENRFIIDLKCPASMQNFMRDISFQGFINPYNRYVRQLAFYRFLNGDQDYEGELIGIAHDGQCIVIRITKDILDFAWAMIEKDIDKLKMALSNPTSFAVTLAMPNDRPTFIALPSMIDDDWFETL